MKSPRPVLVAGIGLWLPGRTGSGAVPSLPVDLSRLRRMDRFARAGFFAGSLALAEAGVPPSRPPKAELGVVFGTAHGCRDSLVDFTLELVAARSVEQLSPSLFAETVHNTVNGELAIAWGLGGPSETVASGRTAGADAILRGADLVRAARAEAVVAGGAEGVHPRMVAWWKEGPPAGAGGRPAAAPVDVGAALVLRPVPPDVKPGSVLMAAAISFFEPDPSVAAARAASWIGGVFRDLPRPLLLDASTDPDGAFSPLECRRTGAESGDCQGAAGAVAAVLAVGAIRGGAAGAVVLCRDPAGPVTLLAFVTPRTA